MADKYASAGKRFLAILVDTIILLIIMLVIAIPFGLSSLMMNAVTDYTGSSLMQFTNFAMWGVYMAIVFIIGLAYFTYFEGKSGQTPGKKALGIKVVGVDGKAIDYTDAFIRTILRIIDGIAFYIVGFIFIIATEKSQRLGDLAAKTVVVKA